MTAGVLAAYTVPAVVAWLAVGLTLTALAAAWPALAPAAAIAAALYGCYFGLIETSGLPGLRPPGRSWQVPQTMMIGASPARRVLVWGTVLGPGFATRNPYAGFGILPLALAATSGTGATLALAGAVGLAHGTARALALLRDVRGIREPVPAAAGPHGAGHHGAGHHGVGHHGGDAGLAHLDLVLRIAYWRRLDGAVLLVVAAAAVAAAARHFT